MRAQLWLDAETHWKLESSEFDSLFRFSPPLRFVFVQNELSVRKVERIRCIKEGRTNLANGETRNYQQLWFFFEGALVWSFEIPADCVWVAGEVEL
jgi:hypothetical protein